MLKIHIRPADQALQAGMMAIALSILIGGIQGYKIEGIADMPSVNAPTYDRLTQFKWGNLAAILTPTIVSFLIIFWLERELSKEIRKHESLSKEIEALKSQQSEEIQQAYEQVERANRDLDIRKAELDALAADLEEKKGQAGAIITRAREKQLELNTRAQTLEKSNAEILQAKLEASIERYITENANRLKLQCQDRISSLLEEEASIRDNLEAFKKELYGQVKSQLEREFLRLDRAKLDFETRQNEARLTLETQKVSHKQDCDRRARDINSRLAELSEIKAILKGWLDRLEVLSKPKKSESIETELELYDKFKAVLFESLDGTLKLSHLRFIAGTEGGKSTLVQNLITLAQAEIPGLKILVADGGGEFNQSDWGGLPRTYTSPDICLDGIEALHTEFEGRTATADPLLFILDEADDVLAGNPEKQKIIQRLLKKGRHKNIFIWFIGQDKNVKPYGLSDSDRTNYGTIVLGNAIVNFLVNGNSLMSSSQCQSYLKQFEKIIEKESQHALFYCLILSKRQPKPELSRTPAPKAFEGILGVDPGTRTGNPVNHPQQPPIELVVNPDELEQVTKALDAEINSISRFQSFRDSAKATIGNPSKAETYRRRKAALIIALKERGLTNLLPKER